MSRWKALYRCTGLETKADVVFSLGEILEREKSNLKQISVFWAMKQYNFLGVFPSHNSEDRMNIIAETSQTLNSMFCVSLFRACFVFALLLLLMTANLPYPMIPPLISPLQVNATIQTWCIASYVQFSMSSWEHNIHPHFLLIIYDSPWVKQALVCLKAYLASSWVTFVVWNFHVFSIIVLGYLPDYIVYLQVFPCDQY